MSIASSCLPLLLAVSLAGGGCASAALLSHGVAAPYAGTRIDAHLASGGSFFDDGQREFTWLVPIAALDLPLTAALDTIALPVVLPIHLLQDRESATKTAAPRGCWRAQEAAAAFRDRVHRGPVGFFRTRSHDEWVEESACDLIDAADFDARHGLHEYDPGAVDLLDTLRHVHGISPEELIPAIRARAADLDPDHRETAEQAVARYERAAATIRARDR